MVERLNLPVRQTRNPTTGVLEPALPGQPADDVNKIAALLDGSIAGELESVQALVADMGGGSLSEGARVFFDASTLGKVRPQSDGPVTWVATSSAFPGLPLNRLPGDFVEYLGATFDRVPTAADASTQTFPSVPRNVTATAGDTTILLDWDPSLTGGPIVEYRVRIAGRTGYVSVPGDTTQHLFTGLTNGTSYTSSVAANNGTLSSALVQAAAVTPVGDSIATTGVKIGSAVDPFETFNGQNTAWAELERRLRVTAGWPGPALTEQVQTARRTYSGQMIPTAWVGSAAADDAGLGVRNHVYSTGVDQYTIATLASNINSIDTNPVAAANSWANNTRTQTANGAGEFDRWVTAGRPDPTTVTNGATLYPWGFKQARFLKSVATTMPTTDFMWYAVFVEPGFVQGAIQRPPNTGTNLPLWRMQYSFQKIAAYGIELTVRFGGPRVKPLVILQSEDSRGASWGDATGTVARTVDHWHAGPWLPAATRAAWLARTNLGFDYYPYSPGDNVLGILRMCQADRIRLGYGGLSIPETAITVYEAGTTTYRVGEPVNAQRHYGDPTFLKGLRHAINELADEGLEFVTIFNSHVITSGVSNPNPRYIHPHATIMRAFAQLALGDPYNIPAGMPTSFSAL